MGDIVNLRAERKRAKRAMAEHAAAANRLLHGRSKSARELDRARAAKTKRDLDGARLETDKKQ
jgi:Domain of unknown function (DUF4169)